MLQRLFGAGVLLGIACIAVGPAQAGSITRSSIWNQAAAMREARSQVPQGAQITGSSCDRVSVANDLDNVEAGQEEEPFEVARFT